MRNISIALVLGLLVPATAVAQNATEAAASVAPAVEQLRHVIGTWDVRTEFLGADGNVAAAADGTYTFDWVIEDRVVQGVSAIPTWDMRAGILFYHRPDKSEVEMVSVGNDGQLWTMTGADTDETRTTPNVTMPDGSKLKLRFTRFNVEPDRFESRMERSTDGGQTWVQGNHQVFVRREQG